MDFSRIVGNDEFVNNLYDKMIEMNPNIKKLIENNRNKRFLCRMLKAIGEISVIKTNSWIMLSVLKDIAQIHKLKRVPKKSLDTFPVCFTECLRDHNYSEKEINKFNLFLIDIIQIIKDNY
jgi:hypothetical protein